MLPNPFKFAGNVVKKTTKIILDEAQKEHSKLKNTVDSATTDDIKYQNTGNIKDSSALPNPFKFAGNVVKKTTETILSEAQKEHSKFKDTVNDVLAKIAKNPNVDDIFGYIISKVKQNDKDGITNAVEKALKDFKSILPVEVMIKTASEGFKKYVINPFIRNYGKIEKISIKNKIIYVRFIPIDMEDVVIDVSCSKIKFSPYGTIYLGGFKSNIECVENALNKYAAREYQIYELNAKVACSLIAKLLLFI